MAIEELLRSVCGIWERQFEFCETAKKTQFGEVADQLWSFLGKSYRDLYLETGEGDQQQFGDVKGPWYKARINKSAEAVALLVPYVLSQLPHRDVNPRRPPLTRELQEAVPQAATLREQIDRDDAMGAYLMSWWLNYTASEYNLKREIRTALPESFVKGRGLLWHEMIDSAAGLIPASLFTSVDDLLIDADTKQLRDAGFVVRKRERSVWRVAEETGLPREQLRSIARTNLKRATDQDNKTPEQTNDICRYYEVYSRMGLGQWLNDTDPEIKPIIASLDSLGHHCYLEIMPGLPYPMNLPPGVLTGPEAADELKRRLQWPIPFYGEMAGNPWPFTPIDYYPHQKDPWADSPLQPGLPMQVFLDHLYCFVMSRVRVASRNILVVAEALEESVKQAIRAGFDLEVVAASGLPGRDLKEMMAFVEFPQLNKDLWNVVPMVERAFEKATGLDPLLYGGESGRQIRSAREAGIREARVNSRPDDYADALEDVLSAAGAKEGLATRLHVGGETVAPLFGERYPQQQEEPYGPLTEKWIELVQTDDEYQAASEFSYTVAAGSARRKNRQQQAGDVQQVIQTLGQPAFQLGMAGVPGPFNALAELLGGALEMPLDKMMIPEGLQLTPDQIRAEGEASRQRQETKK